MLGVRIPRAPPVRNRTAIADFTPEMAASVLRKSLFDPMKTCRVRRRLRLLRWPPAAMPSETSLGALAKDDRCGIEHLDDVRTWMNGEHWMVSISDPDVGKD